MPSEIFPRQNIVSAEIGDNPYFNVFDQSMRFVSDTFSFNRDSYALGVNIIYHSRMSQTLSNLCSGFPDRFKTNYHQFLIEDGEDSNQNPIYKYIDDFGYVHTFYYVNDDLYYCNQSELYLYFDEDSTYFAEIINSKKDKLYFDSNGRLVRIVNGFDTSNVKVITYGRVSRLTSVYDERNPSMKINFLYSNSKISEISCYNLNSVRKKLSFTYYSNFLVNISQTTFNNSKNLYSFYYNSDDSIPNSSFDRIDFIENHITKEVYQIQYSFVNYYNDYLVTLLQKGYFQTSDGAFVAKESLQRTGFSVRTDDYSTTNEVNVVKDNIPFSYSLDKNANITAEFVGYSDSDFLTIYKDTGVYLPISGNSQPVFVNNHYFIKITSLLSIAFSSAAIDLLNDYRYFVLRFYLRLNDHTSKRVKATIIGDDIVSYPTDINVDQYEKYQLVEIPIIRTSNNISSLTISLSIKNENGNYVNVDIGNIHFDKKDCSCVKFLNGSYTLSQVTTVELYTNYYDQQPSRTIDVTGECFFSESDFLNTILHSKNCFNLLFMNLYSPAAHPLYFRNGQVVDYYHFRFRLLVGNTVVFDSYNINNIDLDSNDVWFIETRVCDRTILSTDKDTVNRVYYSFNNSDTIVATRNGIINNDSLVKIYEEKKTYDYYEMLISTTVSKFSVIDGSTLLTSTTEHEYFTNGELKKIASTDGNETIIIYEASENNLGYITRKTSGLSSIDITYSGYQESKITRNSISGATIINSPYSKNYTYDVYDEERKLVAFKCNNNVECSNSFIPNYNDNEVAISNGDTNYKIINDVVDNGTALYVLDNNSYTLLYDYYKNNNNIVMSYANGAIVTYERNTYEKVTHQKLNNVNKVDYSYSGGNESCFAYNLTSVIDKYNDSNGLTTVYAYNSIDNSLSIINYNNDEFIVNQEYFINGTIYDFGSLAMSFIYCDDEVEVRLDNGAIYTFKVERDNFGRIIKHHSRKGYLNKYFIADTAYLSNSLLIDSFTYGVNDTNGTTILYPVYKENYAYDTYGNLSSVYINNESFPRYAYQFDGFKRLVQEYNVSVIEYNRSYTYDTYGRMSSVGNDSLSYDEKGRLVSFGSLSFTYDNYGNRLSKGNELYQWTRGSLLSQITKNNQTIQFTYNYQNIRYQKIINNFLTITYYYHGNRLIGEKHSDDVEIRYLYDGTGIVGFAYYDGTNNNIYRYIKNPFNQIIGIANDSETMVARYVYDAWGNHKVLDAYNNENTSSSFIGNINPIRYKGYYYDVETGLYYLLSRYYDPSVMQFISPDEYRYLDFENISGYHLYAYCGNNPVMYLDENGYVAISLAIIGLIIGAVVGAGIFGTITYNKLKDEGKEGWELYGLTALGALGGAVVGAIVGYVTGAFVTEVTGIVGFSVTKYYVLPINSITVLGSFPAYLNVSNYIGASAFDIDTNLYDLWGPVLQWANNIEYISDAIKLGSNFVVTGLRSANPASALWKEIEYLIENGILWELI